MSVVLVCYRTQQDLLAAQLFFRRRHAPNFDRKADDGRDIDTYSADYASVAHSSQPQRCRDEPERKLKRRRTRVFDGFLSCASAQLQVEETAAAAGVRLHEHRACTSLRPASEAIRRGRRSRTPERKPPARIHVCTTSIFHRRLRLSSCFGAKSSCSQLKYGLLACQRMFILFIECTAAAA